MRADVWFQEKVRKLNSMAMVNRKQKLGELANVESGKNILVCLSKRKRLMLTIDLGKNKNLFSIKTAKWSENINKYLKYKHLLVVFM